MKWTTDGVTALSSRRVGLASMRVYGGFSGTPAKSARTPRRRSLSGRPCSSADVGVVRIGAETGGCKIGGEGQSAPRSLKRRETMPSRDMSKAEFDRACAKYGFKSRGFLGYYSIGGGREVSVLNAGPRRRDQLAYLIQQRGDEHE